MNTWRSSALWAWERTGCAATLVLEREGVPRDQQMFAVGEVCHWLLEQAAQWSREDPDAFEETGEKRLTSLAWSYTVQVPSWGGVPKPPVGPRQAAEGLRIVLRWLRRFGTPDGQSEVGMAVGPDLKTPVEYGSKNARWEGLLDHTIRYDVFDEMSGEEFDALAVDDYKSDWPSIDPLTLQRKGQAILAISHVDELPGRLVLRTRNLRRLKDFTYPTDDVAGDIATWRAELMIVLDAADKAVDGHTVESAARPGHRCRSCPYLPHCEAGLGYSGVIANPEYTIAQHVSDWGSHASLEKLLHDSLVQLVDRAGGVLLTDTEVITRGVKKKRLLDPGAIADLWEDWSEGKDPHAAARSFVTRLGITPSNVEDFIKTCSKRERQGWREWLKSNVSVSLEPSGISVEDRGPDEDAFEPPRFTLPKAKPATRAVSPIGTRAKQKAHQRHLWTKEL